MPSVRSATIVGAGIAGLTAALALARRGIACHVLEQAPALEEVGAGLQLSPNASRILADLGLLEALGARWSEPDHVLLSSGRTLAPLASVPAGAFARKRWGAPYGVLPRAALQAVLLEAVHREPLATLTTGRRIDTVEAALAAAPADLVIAADGVWSALRKDVPGALPARYSGTIAWRFLVPCAAAPPVLDPRAVTAFLGPRAHLVAYPLAGAQAFNIVALHAHGQAPAAGWSRSGDAAARSRLLDAFSGWHADLRRLLAEARDPLMWPLFECPDGAWTDGGKVVLIGDAAHAMTPFAAQGAAMAIEDAALLANHLARASGTSQTLRRFETTRRERVGRVRSRGAFNRFAYHARGPVALGRDLVLSLRGPENLAGDLDWLYGYRTPD
ncbi:MULTISPECIES: FAD-dependent monooxygenase [unclassified Shinella]|uniref:FAD-dependent monooxygenase n=1 Tax=unclassified Shinella TaxID=2643062 RepID=UPI00225CF0B8|nr:MULTISPECIES: FAD-dependent monooxygenase [unclassified Shinella]MCO5140408.1 FAD-dependent monooxygenase [Shinella sp.]MDC7254870.1 FAD-dependent monooxygenase [Shinella sp. YE25]CAI0337622.1 Salicylate hydroxylase [Rhizobiaceae bacterium]CAK7256100.1 salicylate hydroxylase [Shinella sp. WSC3-e]